MNRITGTTQLLGVIGDPIKHSLSPVMHNAAIQHLGVDYVYVPFPIKAEDLEVAIAGFRAIGVQGFSITIPHKQAIIPLLSEVSEIAQFVGAVNTVWCTDKGWSGTNTDVAGFIAPLHAYNRDWSQTKVLILGCGGAARAVVVGCVQLGCKEIHVFARNWEKLEQFQASWAKVSLPVMINIHRWEKVAEFISETTLLVNTTPVGMAPNIEQSPIEETVMQQLSEGAIAYDLIYTPNPTKFLRDAARQNAITIDGLEMLVQQGAAALKIWLGKNPPVDSMRQSLQAYLGLPIEK